MIAVAKFWVKYNGIWHKAGERFEINDNDAGEIAKLCDIDKSEPKKTVKSTESKKAVGATTAKKTTKTTTKKKTD